MLREGLAAEFPFAKRAIGEFIATARSLHVPREAPLWAAMSGFGASWAVGAAGGIVAVALRVAGFHDAAAWLSGGLAIIGYALAVAVATRAGGRTGLAWYVVILAVRTGLQIATALPGILTFCERSGGNCSPLQYATPYAYLAVGLILGAGTVRVVRSGSAGPNASLNAGGAFSLLVGVVGLVFFFAQPQDMVAASAIAFALGGGAAFTAGIVLRFRSARLAPAAFVTALFVVTWIATAGPFVLAVPQVGLSQPASLYLSGLINALALGVGWFAAEKRQRARTTAAA
ncbi:MAG TPA: hypothetical protein VIN37_07585 [Candidatus Limnocylindria bacterium]